MKRHKLFSIAATIILSIFLVGCIGNTAPKELPYAGAFYLNNGELNEIPYGYSYPYKVDANAPIIKNVNAIYVKYTILNIDYLVLEDLDSNKSIPINIDLLNDEIYEIKPKSSLPDGDYCLVIGDPFSTSANLTRWCFKIGDAKAIAATAQAIQNLFEKKLSVTPPYNGFFLVSDQFETIDIPLLKEYGQPYILSIAFEITPNEYKFLPTTSEKLPPILLMSRSISLDELELWSGRPVFGFRFISDSMPCTIRESTNEHFASGDKIISIDGEDIYDCEQLKLTMSRKEPFTPLTIGLQRGTYQEEITTTTTSIALNENIQFSTQFLDNYVAIYPFEELSPGPYCFIDEGAYIRGVYCFRVK